MRWDLHGLTLDGHSDDAVLRDRWQASFASRPLSEATPDLVCALDIAAEVPAPPEGAPQFRQADLIEYYLGGDGQTAVAHLPRFGQLRLDLARGVTQGRLVRAALDTYGVLEDLLAISLSPHLRRRGLFLVHAFAAAQRERAVLIVGDIGAGKTTTGMALLDAGWKLLSNDSPILLRAPGRQWATVLSYPGLLAAYPDTFARFATTRHLAAARPPALGRPKITVAAESVWPGVWLDQGQGAAIVFPQIEPHAKHALEPLRPPEALRMLLPHAVEQWDKAMIPSHLALLGQVVQAAPAYRLRLGPDVEALPTVFERLLNLTEHATRDS